MTLEVEQYTHIPASVAHDALDWLEVRGYFADAPVMAVAESRMFLDEMLMFKPERIPVSLERLKMSSEDRILFKLTFGGV